MRKVELNTAVGGLIVPSHQCICETNVHRNELTTYIQIGQTGKKETLGLSTSVWQDILFVLGKVQRSARYCSYREERKAARIHIFTFHSLI